VRERVRERGARARTCIRSTCTSMNPACTNNTQHTFFPFQGRLKNACTALRAHTHTHAGRGRERGREGHTHTPSIVRVTPQDCQSICAVQGHCKADAERAHARERIGGGISPFRRENPVLGHPKNLYILYHNPTCVCVCVCVYVLHTHASHIIPVYDPPHASSGYLKILGLDSSKHDQARGILFLFFMIISHDETQRRS
jgi:hypothetical protein